MDRLLKLLPFDRAVSARFIEASPDLRRRARLTAAFGVLACTGGWTLALSHFCFFDIPAPSVAAPLLAGTLALAMPLLLMRTSLLVPAAQVVCACWFVAVGWGLHLRGGLASPPLMCQGAVPFIALVILGRRAARIWALVIVAEIGLYVGLFLAGIELPDQMPPSHRLSSNVAAAALFGTLMVSMGWAMEWLREEADAELARTMEKKRQAEREARLLRADRLASVGQLAAGVAHEINNPLSFVIGNLSYLAGVVPDGEARAALDDAVEGAHRVMTIVRDLKTFSRDDEESVELVDVRAVIASSLRLVAAEVRHRAEVRTEFAQCPAVWGSPTRLGQILVNLVLNAAQAMPEEQGRANLISVTLGVTASGDVQIIIADNGAGIPEEIMGRVTEPFFTTKPIGVGTGLGLSVSANLIARLGGTMTLASHLGVGTTATLTLPSAKESVEPPSKLPQSRVSACAPLRILVIDDEAATLRSLERLLRDHEVICCSGGREGLRRLAEDQEGFDLVLCDLMMPDLNGLNVAYGVEQRNLSTSLVIMTAGATTEEAKAFLASKRFPLLTKPIDPVALFELVDRLPGQAQRVPIRGR